MNCIHCGRSNFPTKALLDEHLRVLHKGSPNKPARTCISCPPPDNVFVELEQHFIDKHRVKAALDWPCPHCEKPFLTAIKRNRHERDCDKRPAGEWVR